VQVGVLGPVEVSRDGSPVPIAGARMRALLTRLALGRGRAVAAGDLIDAVWGAAESDDPANALQSLVSRLRRALGDPASVVPTPGGYRLAVNADDVDAHRFETLARSGRSSLRAGRFDDAATALTQALSLWRGAALADLPDDPWAAALTDARQAALEDRLEADIGRGLAAEAAAELEIIVAAAPMRERAAALLMDALVADGRGAEALSVYERTRSGLADELGADPGAGLIERHLRILRSEPPAASEARRARTNLRGALTTFVGREADMSAVAERLSEHRLVTLVGPGGSGKTRLAGEVGSAMVDRFPDGVWLVELAGVTDPGDVVGAAVGTLGVREAALFDTRSAGVRRGPLEQLHDALTDRDLLLILDNCEHVLDAVAELVEYLLTRCPGLRILTTSRESLALPGESLYPVPPLGHSSDGAAVVLFLDRAHAIGSAVVDDLPAVQEICRRLDGLPLAIELAAARTRGLTVRQIADRLNDRFRLLSGGNRVAVARHRTLRAVVEWSWSLLTADERWLLEQLSVFAGGASVESADAIWTAAGRRGDTVDLLAALVDKSLLQLVNASTPRYRMLETIREFGVDRMAERDELAAARARHAEHFRDWAVSVEPLTRTSEQMVWIARFNDERDNVFAAIQHLMDTGAADDAVTLAMAMGWFWTMRGEHAVAVTWLGDALSVPGGTASAERTVATALRTMNAGMWTTGGDEPGMDIAALDAYADPDKNPMAVVMRAVGLVFGDGLETADGYLAEMIERTDGWPQATLLMVRALLAENDGHLELSRRSLDRALTAFRSIGERFGLASCLELHARLALLDRDLDETLATLDQAATITRELGAYEDAGATMCWRASAHLRLSDPDAARADLALGEADFARVGSVFGAVLTDAVRGQILRYEGELGLARATIARARQRINGEVRISPPQALAMLLIAAAEVEISDGQLDDGSALAAEAASTAVASRDLPVVSQTVVLWATIAWHRGEPALAAELLGAADGLRGAPDPTHPEVIALERDLPAALGAPTFARLRQQGCSRPREDAIALLTDTAGISSKPVTVP
jgi:predicted ATPase/DNA-binding SARP family transcriptional activator